MTRDELKAKVEAATPLPWAADGESYNGGLKLLYSTAPRGERETIHIALMSPANAGLIVTAVNLARRITSDEEVEQACQVARALRFRLYNADEGDEGFDMDAMEIERRTFLAAITALLSEER
jgi:hypothetical protein